MKVPPCHGRRPGDPYAHAAFDSSLGYSPKDICPVSTSVITECRDVVLGTWLLRVNTMCPSRAMQWATKFPLAVTLWINVYFSVLLSFVKLAPSALFRERPLHESGFGLDAEIAAFLLTRRMRPFEVSISYHSRRGSSRKGDRLAGQPPVLRSGRSAVPQDRWGDKRLIQRVARRARDGINPTVWSQGDVLAFRNVGEKMRSSAVELV